MVNSPCCRSPLALPAEQDDRGQGVLRVGSDPTADRAPASVLDGLLHAAGTRLLVLHDPTPDGSAAPALWQIAGGIVGAGGPPTLVVRFPVRPDRTGPHAAQAVYRFFEVFYVNNVIHAQGIRVSWCRLLLEGWQGPAARSWVAFFSRERGEEILHLSRILDHLKTDVEAQRTAVQDVEDTWTSLREQLAGLRRSKPSMGGVTFGKGVLDYKYPEAVVGAPRRDFEEYAEHVKSLTPDYMHETGGLLPLADELRELPRLSVARAETEAAVEELRRYVEEETARRDARYLNTRFTRSRPEPGSSQDRDPVPPESTLKYGRTYYLAVDIRADRSGSHAADEIVWPDSQLPDQELAEAQGGRSLRVALFSRDFTLLEDQKPLWLPLYGPSERLYFRVEAPLTSLHAAPKQEMLKQQGSVQTRHHRLGLAQIRVCVYYKNNLVQSRMVYAQIGRSERTGAERGNWSEVEHTLSATFGDLDRLRPRGLNLVFNQGRDGTHAILVRGDGLKDNVFDLRDEMTLAVKEFRETLSRIMFEDGTEVYRLNRRRDEPNWGTDETLTTDLRRLAHVGSKWYRDLFGAEKLELAETLRQRLEEPTIIQVVRARGKQVFPWAIIYDLPLVRSPSNHVCLEFRQHPTPEGTLDYVSCRAACPHLDRGHPQSAGTATPAKHDTNVVCPFGFWGIKHVVEQPLSASIKLGEEDEDGAERRPSSVHSVIPYEDTPALHVGISLKLRLVGQHVQALQDWIGREGAFQAFQPEQTLEAIGRGLSSTPLHIYYFYCHGGKSERDVWLSVGDGEYVLPDHIRFEWELYQRWARGQPPFAPLVFLNGCGTLSLSPESIAEFLHEFTVAGAAGVIGTEISVDERLAQEVGLGFLQAFAVRAAPGATPVPPCATPVPGTGGDWRRTGSRFEHD